MNCTFNWQLIITVLASFGALIISILNLRVIYRERIRFYREKLYEKQLDIYPKIIKSIEELVGKTILFISVPDNNQLWKKQKEELRLVMESLSSYSGLYSTFTSEEMNKFIQNLYSEIAKIIQPKLKGSILSQEELIKTGKELSNYLTQSIGIARKDLQTTSLSSETISLISKTISEKNTDKEDK